MLRYFVTNNHNNRPEVFLKIPCAKHLPFIVCGLSFLVKELTNIQFQNLTMIATALVLGSRFCITEISQMWLKEKCVSTLSHFLSNAKFSTHQMQHLYILNTLKQYNIQQGYFIIDDTLSHHSKFCKWIHGVFVLFDHAIGTNLKAVCIVFLYFYDGKSIKFPIDFRIFYKETSTIPWFGINPHEHKNKYSLAVDMLKQAMKKGFPKCVVLADAWYAIQPFVKELKGLNLSYVLEAKSNYTIKVPCETPKLTAKGKLSKKQYSLISLPEYFKSVTAVTAYGFILDRDEKRKVIYHTKTVTDKFNAIQGIHRIVESVDAAKQTTKYFLTDQLTWEASKIISIYRYRWVIEEFFRNAKQLSDMEGATIRSKQGVTLTLCLVTWIDFLLHYENYKRRTALELPKEPFTIPSIVRQAKFENLKALFDRVQNEEGFVQKWFKVAGQNIHSNRRRDKHLITIDSIENIDNTEFKKAA